jgi:hypothetical protein
MPNLRNRFPARRRFLKQSAALTATASLAAPMLVVTQTAASDAAASASPDATGARATTESLPSQASPMRRAATRSHR